MQCANRERLSLKRHSQIRMTNDRKPKEYRNPNDETADHNSEPRSPFELWISFVIRHSAFDTLYRTTMFTNFFGTTMIFSIALPSRNGFTFSADFAAVSRSV